jgi:hypothetical protein
MSSPRTAVHPAGARRPGNRSSARRRPASRQRRRRPARRRRRKSTDLRRWWPGLLLAVAVLTAVAWDTETTAVPAGQCAVVGTSLLLTAEQTANVTAIAGVARDRGLPDRAIVIALATAQQESRLRNLDYGDRDSLGLFQQRPSQGWGSEAEVQDPVYAAGIFYDRLVRVPGWDTGRLTDVAQTVQRSGFPEAYQQWEPMAAELTAAFGTSDPPTLDCA